MTFRILGLQFIRQDALLRQARRCAELVHAFS